MSCQIELYSKIHELEVTVADQYSIEARCRLSNLSSGCRPSWFDSRTSCRAGKLNYDQIIAFGACKFSAPFDLGSFVWFPSLVQSLLYVTRSRVGPQTLQSRINVQQNKECLINISKFKFSMVISGLTKTLSKISEMQPTIRSGHSLNFFLFAYL